MGLDRALHVVFDTHLLCASNSARLAWLRCGVRNALCGLPVSRHPRSAQDMDVFRQRRGTCADRLAVVPAGSFLPNRPRFSGTVWKGTPMESAFFLGGSSRLDGRCRGSLFGATHLSVDRWRIGAVGVHHQTQPESVLIACWTVRISHRFWHYANAAGYLRGTGRT